jgi:hypothetical protein
MLFDHHYPVALADAVVHTGDLYFELAELLALGSEVLRAGVQTVDLLV